VSLCFYPFYIAQNTFAHLIPIALLLVVHRHDNDRCNRRDANQDHLPHLADKTLMTPQTTVDTGRLTLKGSPTYQHQSSARICSSATTFVIEVTDFLVPIRKEHHQMGSKTLLYLHKIIQNRTY
jgi:hypothetical protein